MNIKPKSFILIGLTLLLAAVLVACKGQAPAATVEEQPCPTAAPCPECPECPPPPEPVVKEVPFQDMWANSAHNDAEAEAFNHWNEEDPPEIPVACATCHSTAGYQDFLGADGSAPGVDQAVPAPAGTIQCVACHNAVTATLSKVTFPSGVEVSGLDASARCMVCHQGRAWKGAVDEQIEKFGVTEDVDSVPAPIEDSTMGFVNIHYFAAAATLYGSQVQGGYEYAGKSYDYKNDHVAGYNSCIGCHNPHTLELKLEECAVCHQGVASVEDVRNIRMAGSMVDYDGDGDITEGVAFEIDGLREMLYQAIQAYASEVAGAPIVYDAGAYPYFFNDTNANGAVDEGEAVFPNSYKSWTARLLKAAYNYQVSTKDPGAFAHGGKYIIQLLYDSIEDLNQALSTPVDLSTAHRIDRGHFAGSEEAFRHWDEEGEVPAACAKCHSAAGLPLFLKEGVSISQPVSNGLNCATCHDDLSTFTRRTVDSVKFPSGASLTFGEGNDSNLCINCHQGRESKASVDAAIGELGDDEVGEKLSFRNPHYFAAGATLFGADANGAYMYEGKEYTGRNMHVAGFDTCLGCHDAHALRVKFEACSSCHPMVKSEEDLKLIRVSTDTDFDGDGDAGEGIAGELETMAELLYQAIRDYAAAQGLPPIVYQPHVYPYFFVDTNGNGEADADEANFNNRYTSWTPRLLRAAYNYQWFMKDPGAFAHNGKFMLQVLFDSLQDLGVNLTGKTRPAVPAQP